MFSRRNALLTAIVLLVVVVGAYAWARCACPAAGLAFAAKRRELHRQKNRIAFPQPGDFDPSVTLEKMLTPGDDRNRWSSARAGRVEGYVVAADAAKLEFSNCLARRDVHIQLGTSPDARPNQQLIVEVPPGIQDLMRGQGLDWSPAALEKTITGKRCAFDGWLFLDEGHIDEAENTAPRRDKNWRATAWEIHPVTRIQCEQTDSSK